MFEALVIAYMILNILGLLFILGALKNLAQAGILMSRGGQSLTNWATEHEANHDKGKRRTLTTPSAEAPTRRT